MPLYRRLPKRGFNPIRKDNIAIINLDKIQTFIDKKNIKVNDLILAIPSSGLHSNGYSLVRYLLNQKKNQH
jgi:phosphoribosylaminoimidazole (AIR) synthetase